MKQITSILVPTDFSPVALNAYRYALRLGEALGASIDLLYAVPPTPASHGYGSFVDHLTVTLQQEARAEVVKFYRRGMAEVAGQVDRMPGVRTFVRVGELGFCLRQHVEQEGNQLLVMGTSGSQSGWDNLLGTQTASLVQRAPCPLLVVPAKATYTPPREICFATDLQTVGAFQVRKVMHALQAFRPHLHFIHVRQEQRQETAYDLELLREIFDRADYGDGASFTDRQAVDTIGAIFAYALETKCHWVVMHRPDRPWFQRLFHQSSTRQAVLRASLPLLILTTDDLMARDAEGPLASASRSLGRA